MALKGDRQLNTVSILFTANAVAEAGQMLVYKSGQPTGAGVGQGLDEAAPVADVLPTGAGNPASGTKFAGVLLSPVVSIDTTRQHRNWQNTEQLVGEPVPLLTDGFVWTNRVNGTPAAGDAAYVGASGNFQNTSVNNLPTVGKFETSKDADGYARVSVKMA